jgi:hypothetical protein
LPLFIIMATYLDALQPDDTIAPFGEFAPRFAA